MTVDDVLISRLARLAKLDPDTEQRQLLAKDLDNILTMVDKLNELELDGVEPLRYLGQTSQQLREDVVDHQLDRADALQNAPDTDPTHTYFRVPRVI